MIELSVSLASNGVLKVPCYEQLVRFGYTKNRGVYRLHVDATGEWEGLAIRCFWHVPDGKDPVSSLVVDGYVAVPASVTAQPGSGCVTFEGSDGSKTVTSADLRYRVSANSGTEDGTEPEPGTPAWQQLVDAVHTDATAAEQAKTDAQTAAQQAGASAQKAGQALSDTIAAKEDALKATKDAQTAASEAATSAGNASQSAQEAADSLQALKDGIASGDFKGEPGNDGKSPVVTVTDIENGHRVSITDKDGTKTIDVLNGQTGKTGATPVLTIGTATNDFTILLHDDNKYRLTRGIYYLTTSGLSPSVTLNFYYIGKFSSDVQNRQVTLTRDSEFSLRLQIIKGATLNTTVQVSLTRNKIITYAPYSEQLLTLLTPNGLPGIPVTSGGNYTDPQGQQWVCDEVDLERGVRVQRVDKAAFDSTKTLAEQNAILATPIETPLTPAEIAAYKALTTYGPDTVVQAGDGAGIKLEYQRDVNIAIKRIEDAVASMTTT